MKTPRQQFFPRVIDSSILSAFRSCPQKFFRQYIQHLKSKGEASIHLHAGGAYAHGLEQARTAFYIDGKSEQEAEAIGLDALSTYYGDFECPPNVAKTKERMMGAMDFYFQNYPMSTDQAKPYHLPGGGQGIEFSFAEPLPILNPDTGEPIIFSGRADMIVDFAGGVFLEDDKTTSSLGASWGKQWEMRGQFTGYSWAAQQTGIPITGVLIRGISILKTKYETQQIVTYRSQMEIDRWYEQTIRDINRMIAMYHANDFDYNLDESCNHYGGCHLTIACKSTDPEPWYDSYFEQRVWDPLNREELPINVYLQKERGE